MRDDFSQRTKDLLANRVGWKCSNPKQTDNHRYADVYIGQMLWAFLTQENF